MTYQKALGVLGLNSFFTGKELKRRYHHLSQKYHPDLYQNKSIEEQKTAKERMQEINIAYETIKAGRKNLNQDFEEISEYYQTLHKKLKAYLMQRPIEPLKSYNEAINDIIDKFNFSVFSSSKDSFFTIKENIDNYYFLALNQIKNVYTKLKDYLYTKEYINAMEVDHLLNYNCSLDEFYNALLNIVSKYGVKAKLKKKIDEEILKYTSFARYKHIQEEISQITKTVMDQIIMSMECLEALKNNTHHPIIDKIIIRMHKEIANAFANHYALQHKIIGYKNQIIKIDDPGITTFYNELSQMINGNYPLKTLNREYRHLEKLIEAYYQKEDLKQDRLSLIAKVYKTIHLNYLNAIKHLENEQDFEKIAFASFIFGKVMEELSLIKEGRSPIANLEVLKHLSFTNYAELQELNKNKYQDSGIYIRKTKANTIGAVLAGKITHQDYKYVTLQGIQEYLAGEYTLTKEEFNANYLTLEQFLAESSYLGTFNEFYNLVILYANDAVEICYDAFSKSILIKTYTPNKSTVKSFDPAHLAFKDQAKMKEAIIFYLNNIIAELNSKQDKSRVRK